ncbi:hypothetical protein GE061_009193 [Apolygus lucorum]|uniref:Ig-like domain-containing protein n=1 Tax=Apolygus lucorum TaxID=248454 RepID=A0A8S9XZH3_APOLU|nr:hypothetical protein GE061_009193 [Apolygus lucorum]
MQKLFMWSTPCDNVPRFLTEGRHHRVVQSDTLLLPCKVSNIGNLIRAWKKGIAVLTAGGVKLSPDERLSLVHGYDLEIRDVKSEDEGDYVCQIASLTPMEITHTVEILVPPQIVEVSGSGLVEVRKGTPVGLECRAKGNPTPFYQWSRRTNTTWPGLKPINGSTINMGPATRHMAGRYQCIASNGVGRPAVREVVLKVLYAPEVDADEKWVHSGIGNQAILACTVHADPEAEVRWYRSALKLEVTDDHKTERRSNRYLLIILKVQLQDLDNYTCEAQNNFGKARQFILVSGKPHQAIFRSPSTSRWRDGYNISWSVFSYTAIEEHKLFYRRKQFDGRIPTSVLSERWGGNLTYYNVREWTDVSIAVQNDYRHVDITQEMNYMILGLEANTQYEAKVQARNTFGWSKMSDIFVFSTSSEGGFSWETHDIFQTHENEIRDLGVTAQGKAVKTWSPPAVLTSAVLLVLALNGRP